MQQHLYLSLMPEALIASMLEPEDFGNYYAVGNAGTGQGEAVFLEVDPAFRDGGFPIDAALSRCVPHKNGEPKHTVYISAYRVLERLPLSALGRLYLVTRDGRSLALDRASAPPADESGLHLYHELAPTRPVVVSSLGPRGFFELIIGKRDNFPALPAIAFAELGLGELASDPENGGVGDLPYENIRHLRAVLAALKEKAIAAKIFERCGPPSFSFRMIKNGLYLGRAQEGLAFYQFPGAAALKAAHRDWWRSANL
jgi:hypothetical protein